MGPLRQLRMTWHQSRRRCGLLLPALVASVLLVLVLVDHGLQHQSAALPQAWRARQPAEAAARGAVLSRAAGGERHADADWATGATTGPAAALTGQQPSAPDRAPVEKRSYVSGTRFVDVDPSAGESEGREEPATAPARPRDEKYVKNTKEDKAIPLSNDVLPVSNSRAIKKDAAGPKPWISADVRLPVGAESSYRNGSKNPAASAHSLPGPTSAQSLIADPASVTNLNSHAGPPASTGRAAASDSDSDRGVYELPGCGCSRAFSRSAQRALNGTRSNCGFTADMRGPKQNVISFSFYGNASSVFFRGIEANLARVPEVYPGWVVRVYHDINLSVPQQRQLVCDVQCR